jgi:hypothetical protein
MPPVKLINTARILSLPAMDAASAVPDKKPAKPEKYVMSVIVRVLNEKPP